MKRFAGHLIVAIAAAAAAIAAVVPVASAGLQAGPEGPASFVVFLRGARLGSEDVNLTKTADGWTISSSGRIGAPVDFSFSRFEVTYTADWQPRTLSIDGQSKGQIVLLNTTFGLTTALNDIMQGGQKSAVTHQVSARTVVLPNNFYAGYEALAARLSSLEAGATLPIYVAPQAEITASVERVTPRRIETPAGNHDVRQFDVVFKNPAGPVAVEIWVDARGRLARLAIPAAAVIVVREELATVMARVDTFSHPGDKDVFIAANGFSLAGTVTTPPGNAAKRPAVILIAGSGPQDRDENVFGIPVLGQVAGALADAGFMVVRYDKRGVGQSGGRIESVSLQTYAEDVRAVVEWLRKQPGVDRDRIALVGHSEGGAVALLAGRDYGRVKAIALVAAPGATGREVTLEQQRRALAMMSEPDATKQARVALQNRLMDAVVTGRGWEAVPPELKRQSDTPWFRSWLTYDPAAVMKGVDQPVLIVQGTLDTQVPPPHADRLEALSRARKGKPDTHTRKIVVSGINHLLVPATTGEVAEYSALTVKTVSADVTAAIAAWLGDVFKEMK